MKIKLVGGKPKNAPGISSDTALLNTLIKKND